MTAEVSELNPWKSYTDFVLEQVLKLTVDKPELLNTGGKHISDFRVALAYVAKRYVRAKFKTKKGFGDLVWVTRIS